MIPEYPKFKQLETKDRRMLAEHLKDAKRKTCEMSIGNLFLWSDFDRPELTRINNNLCILINPLNEAPFFLEPLGKNQLLETVNNCLEHAKALSRVTEDFIKLIPADKYAISPLRGHFDYLCSVDDLAQLKGRKYDGKRNHIKHFSRSHPDYEYRTIDQSLKAPALLLFEKWFSIREKSRFFSRLAHAAQEKALASAFDQFSDIPLFGGGIFIENEIKGFILGSRISADTCSAHFSYTDPSIRGISQALFWEACKKTFAGYVYVNLEQDLGIPGLRQAKLSYHPVKIEKKFEVKLRF